MHATANNFNVSLSYQFFGGFLTQHMSGTVKGKRENVEEYLAWLATVVMLNS